MFDMGAVARSEALVSAARRLGELLEVDALEPPEAAAVWRSLVEAQRVVAGLATLLARRLEHDGSWRATGAASAADLVARTAGVGNVEARRLLETSERLARQPEVAEAVRAGRLSPAQAHLVTDAVQSDPAAAPGLLEAAGSHALSRLREACNEAKFRADPDPDARHRRIHARRHCRTFTDTDGSWRLEARGTPEAGARLMVELERLTDLHFVAARDQGRREHLEAYRFDALIDLARRSAVAGGPAGRAALGSVSGSHHAMDATAASSGDASPPVENRRRTGGESFLAILRIDLAALLRGSAAGDEICEIAGLGSVPVRVARELLGESIVKLIVTRGEDANVTHLGRGPRIAQKIALLWRTPRCSVPGCAGTRLETDHRIDFARTRRTTLAELQVLCHHHHRLKTRYNWALTSDGGQVEFVAPDHPRHPSHVREADPCRSGDRRNPDQTRQVGHSTRRGPPP